MGICVCIFLRLVRLAIKDDNRIIRANRINEASATVYKLVVAKLVVYVVQLAVSLIGLFMITDGKVSEPLYAPVPIPLQSTNET